MKLIAFFIISLSTSLCMASVAPAKTTAATTENQVINSTKPVQRQFHAQGSWRLGLGFGLGYSSARGMIGLIALQPEKYVIDNLAIGGLISYDNIKSFNTLQFGPSLTYQFWSKNTLHAFFSQRIIQSSYSGTSYTKDLTDYKSISELGVGWSILEAFIYHREMLDDSYFYESKNGYGLRLAIYF